MGKVVGGGNTTGEYSGILPWGRSPRCNIPSFVKIIPPVLEKKIFEGLLPYMGVAAILVM